MEFIDYYELLQVSPNAHIEVIRSAYRTMMSKLNIHPDKGGDEETAKLFNEAFEILNNEEKRKMYDMFYERFTNHGLRSHIKLNEKNVDKIDVRENKVLYGHNRGIKLLTIGVSNAIIASCESSGFMDALVGIRESQIRFWDINSGSELAFMKINDPSIELLKLSISSNFIAVSSPHFIKIIDINNSDEIFIYEVDTDCFIEGVCFNDDLSLLALGVSGGIQLFNPLLNQEVAMLAGSYIPTKIWMDKKGQILATNLNKLKKIDVWDVKKKRVLNSFSCGFDAKVAVNSTGKTIAVYNRYDDDSIIFWDTFSGEKIKELHFWSHRMQFSQHDKYFLIAGADGIVKILETKRFEDVMTFKAHEKLVTSIISNSDDTKIITGSEDMLIKIWDIQ